MSSLAKIWKRRILAGTQKITDCPKSEKGDVITLIRSDISNGTLTKETLYSLVESGMMEQYEYDVIIEGL